MTKMVNFKQSLIDISFGFSPSPAPRKRDQNQFKLKHNTPKSDSFVKTALIKPLSPALLARIEQERKNNKQNITELKIITERERESGEQHKQTFNYGFVSGR